MKVGILTLSDRAYEGIYDDISGNEIRKVMQDYAKEELEFEYILIPDEQNLIEEKLIHLVDNLDCDLVMTTGGTGPAPRDVTPEATENICDKMMPGFGEVMRAHSLQYTPTSILSRQVAGIRGKALIVNLPGKPTAIRECMESIIKAIPYCITLSGGNSFTLK